MLPTKTKTVTKLSTEVSTQAAVAVLTLAALAALAAVAYGYGFGFGATRSVSLPTTSGVATAIRPAKLGSQIISAQAQVNIVTTAKNKPVYTQLQTKPLFINSPNTAAVQYVTKFKLEYQKDPAQYGKVSIKQLLFHVSLPKSASLDAMQLLHYGSLNDTGNPTKLDPNHIRAFRVSDPGKIFSVDSGESIGAFGSEEKFYVVISFDNEYVLPASGDIFVMSAGTQLANVVSGATIKITFIPSLYLPAPSTNGGHLLNNRTAGTTPFPLFPASSYIFHLIRLEPPTDGDSNNLKASYLQIAPSLYSDNSGLNHSAIVPGSPDWFPFEGDAQPVSDLIK